MMSKALVRYAVKELGKKKVAVAYLNDEYGKNGLRGVKEALWMNWVWRLQPRSLWKTERPILKPTP